MDKNRIPSSSPMQHHNESCGRPSTSTSSSDPTTQPSSSAVPRPSSSSHQSPTTKPNSLSGKTSWTSSGGSWTGENEGGSSNAQCVASSSRLPSTNLFPGAEETHLHAVEDVEPYLEIETPGSALLTSEPLDRCSSTQPSPDLSNRSIAPSPLPLPNSGPSSRARTTTGKRRNRASSLPTAEPVFKRRRAIADLPTPSEEFARTFATRRRESSRLSGHQARAKELGERLLAGRSLKGGCRAGEQIIVASHNPPINNKTLRSLDAHEILKQPQLRHDLLFDTLAFRPINSSVSGTYSETIMSGAEIAAESSGAASGTVEKRVCTVTDMYWESVEMEINTGCRCTRWQVPIGLQLDVKGIKGKERMMDCVCGKWRADMSENDWWVFQKSSRTWTSRLPELIKTLREILISLMGSTTPCPNHFAHSFSREALDLHEQTCPTVTHALVPQLYEALDPEFLTRRVRRKTFDLSLFEMLGEAMKVHCAPIRDGLVDEMVRIASGSKQVSGNVALGLRKCFDCVEIMKLDIANHQVHALRPYLWSCAQQYELSAFNAYLSSNSTPLLTSSTRDWIRSSSLRVLARATPQDRVHLLGSCPCRLGDNTELVLRTAADGFVGLIFADQASQAGSVPESLRMDVRRIQAFHAESVNLTNIHLLLLACRDILPSIHPSLPAKSVQSAIESISTDLTLILSAHPIRAGEPDGEVSLQLAARLLRLDPSSRNTFPYSQAEHVQLARLADQLTQYINTHIRPESTLFGHSFRRLEELTRLMLTHELMKLEGEMTVEDDFKGVLACEAIRKGARVKVEEEDEDEELEEEDEDESMVDDTPILGEVPSPTDAQPPREQIDSVQIRQRSRQLRSEQRAEEKRLARLYGLDVMFTDIKGLVKRMERIIGFNVTVFRDVYGESGMVVGA